ncbi:hypothetical protein F5Y16DRAFT_384640 [Xylariaceae sp. FL0255]|nr:hypothetical protein F5Y16DRAFT_384640 [Xylariaceae sp. FL0255]
MSEAEPNLPLERRPACDTCKGRKTKCDRKSPCASCVTLKIPCRTSARTGEKRQRVLISSKYEDALQDVGRQLADVREMLRQALASQRQDNNGGYSVSCHPSHHHHSPLPGYPQRQQQTGISPETASGTPKSIIDEKVPTLQNVQEGFAGDSSFQYQAQEVKTVLESTLASIGLSDVEPGQMSSSTTAAIPVPPPLDLNDIDAGSIPLPPVDIVLRLLRLAKLSKQPFFIAVPIFEEVEFTNMCRDVYFATEPVSLWKWIGVNVGLYELFLGLNNNKNDDDVHARLGTSPDALERHCEMIKANVDAAMQSLRLCSEPSWESCRALAALTSFYIKLGQSTIAWRLISGAARAALDLGLHRMPSELRKNPSNPDDIIIPKETSLFWHIYSWDKALAMTSGRTPTIHHYDVTSGLGLFKTTTGIAGVGTLREVLFRVWIEFSIVTGEIQESLFSAEAQRAALQDRQGHVERFSARLRGLQRSVQSVNQTDSATWDEQFSDIANVLDISIHCQLAVVHRLLPPKKTQQQQHSPHPLQCSEECVNESRAAISALVSVGDVVLPVSATGWARFMNTVLSMVPLVPFLVLAGNAIATSPSSSAEEEEEEDLNLLSRFIALLDPVVPVSPAIRKIHDACAPFHRIAQLVAASRRSMTAVGVGVGMTTSQNREHENAMNQEDPGSIPAGPAYEDAPPSPTGAFGFPMGQQDWDSIMTGFESELGVDYDSKMLTDIIEPYFANAAW